MDNEHLQHWGIKGMKWGVRRFQNKNGSLTPEGKKRYSDDNDGETVEAKRERLLKSTDANEIYKNRSLLTTNELNDRLNRINTEKRLSEVAASTKKTGYDRINSLLKAGNKINEIYQFTQTPVMKALMSKINPKLDPERIGLADAFKNMSKLTDKQLDEVINRTNKENTLKKLAEEASNPSPKVDVRNLEDVLKNVNDLPLSTMKEAIGIRQNTKILEKLFQEELDTYVPKHAKKN